MFLFRILLLVGLVLGTGVLVLVLVSGGGGGRGIWRGRETELRGFNNSSSSRNSSGRRWRRFRREVILPRLKQPVRIEACL
jgi:hypothetical protein